MTQLPSRVGLVGGVIPEVMVIDGGVGESEILRRSVEGGGDE